MNDNQRRLLPPMGALASFVAAARHGSFSRAGGDMGLTQSAISRQIAVLEGWLQTTLFTRTGRRVRLSETGEAYAKAVGPALERIRAASAAILERRSAAELNIATLPSFGMRWLAPRLRLLTSEHPDIVVNFAARSFPFSFADEPFDVAIHFGLPDWPGATHEKLFSEEAVPVCAPASLAASPIDQPSDVLKWPLLVQSSRRNAWTEWLGLAGVDSPPPPPSASFEHFLMLAQAAVAGAGIALIPRFLIETELEEGQLMSPLPISLRGDGAYYLVLPEGRPVPNALAQFRTWLLAEAAAFETAGAGRIVQGQRKPVNAQARAGSNL